jgi:hypothetical protein
MDRIPAAIPTMNGEEEISHTTHGIVIIWNQTADALHRLLSHSRRKSRWRSATKVLNLAGRLGFGSGPEPGP